MPQYARMKSGGGGAGTCGDPVGRSPCRSEASQATDARLEETALPYCKLCELEDFNRSELWPFLQEVFADVFRDVAAFPARKEHRKLW